MTKRFKQLYAIIQERCKLLLLFLEGGRAQVVCVCVCVCVWGGGGGGGVRVRRLESKFKLSLVKHDNNFRQKQITC